MIEEKLRTLAAEYDMLPRGGTVLCAVSGGLDSMCLLHLLRGLEGELGFQTTAAHFNHSLRGEQSDRDETFVADWCSKEGIPLVRGRGDVAGEAARTGRGVEETARELRYAFLENAARQVGAQRLATAHTADDNAETLLLHLVRGAGLQGLTGIPPRRGAVVRPLLNVTRREIEEYCAAHGVPHVEDNSNTDETYHRNFVRRQVMPLLRQINPRAAEHMSAAAARLRADNDYLNARAAQAAALARVTPDGVILEARVLSDLPRPVASRCARRVLELAGGGRDCTAAHLEALTELCRSGGPSAQLMLPGITVQRVYGELVLLPAGEETGSIPPPVPLDREGITHWGGWKITSRRTVCPEEAGKKGHTFFLACGKIKGVPVLRSRQTGDMLQLPGRPAKSLKKLMIEEKIPQMQRQALPVLADDAGVLAVAGLGPHAPRLARPGEAALEILLEKE